MLKNKGNSRKANFLELEGEWLSEWIKKTTLQYITIHTFFLLPELLLGWTIIYVPCVAKPFYVKTRYLNANSRHPYSCRHPLHFLSHMKAFGLSLYPFSYFRGHLVNILIWKKLHSVITYGTAGAQYNLLWSLLISLFKGLISYSIKNIVCARRDYVRYINNDYVHLQMSHVVKDWGVMEAKLVTQEGDNERIRGEMRKFIWGEDLVQILVCFP